MIHRGYEKTWQETVVHDILVQDATNEQLRKTSLRNKSKDNDFIQNKSVAPVPTGHGIYAETRGNIG
jgi:hypothetical protein